MPQDLTIYATFWTWLIAAVVLAGLEALTPGVFMIWLAGAAAITGVLTLVVDLGWQLQLVAFAVLSVVAVIYGRAWFERHPMMDHTHGLNRRGERMIGQQVTVIEAISGGEGRVMVGDSPWLACGPDLAAGARARIVAVDGSRLTVEAV